MTTSPDRAIFERVFDEGCEAPAANGISWQPSLFDLDDPWVDEGFAGLRRLDLGDEVWVDRCPGWLRGSAEVMSLLVQRRRWCQRDVVMYDRVVAEPRLTSWWSPGHGPVPLPVLDHVRRALSRRYDRRFDSIGMNLYRDGSDSVAWHRDRVMHRADATIAIVSVGEPRPFAMRPLGGRTTYTFELGAGDLLVMGGACQEHWEHAVLKSRRICGPRLSITFRHGPIRQRRGVVGSTTVVAAHRT